jgi:predicted house-cleaning noncanonical NTP pyrophosphatase (MazG superfamily)
MKKTDLITQVERDIEYMKSMMDSCYCYHSLSKDERYLQQYKEKLGEDIFNKVYDEYAEYLKDTFDVKVGVHEDSEGVTYNSLVKR